MKTIVSATNSSKTTSRADKYNSLVNHRNCYLRYSVKVLSTTLLMLIVSSTCALAATDQSTVIRAELSRQGKYLSYPLSVKRLYSAENYKLLWVAPDSVKAHAYDAMLLIDCVRQYGLNHADYHPDKLLYDKLNMLTRSYAAASDTDKAEFDIFLTDAMIAFINNLHYGKLNPRYSIAKLDVGRGDGLQAENVLAQAMKRDDFLKAIESVQPKSAEYVALQRQLHLLAGVYVGDCYDTPPATIKQIAINMERLRWAGVDGDRFIQINIPSFDLKLHQPDTDLFFKVAVGKASTPTPRFKSIVSGFITGTNLLYPRQGLPSSLKDNSYEQKNEYQIYDREGRVLEPSTANIMMARQNPSKYFIQKQVYPQSNEEKIAFDFSNDRGIFIVSETNKQLFKNSKRDITGGLVKVNALKELVTDLLVADGQPETITNLDKTMAGKLKKEFRLKTKLPLYITYLTCQMKEGVLETYPDVYRLDGKLDKALFGSAVFTPSYW